MPPTRREILRQTPTIAALAAAASALGPVHAFASLAPQSIRMGVIGCGGIAQLHVEGLVKRGNEVSLAWLCDVDPRQIERTLSLIRNLGSQAAPRTTNRSEEVLDDPDVDAVLIATPHHWHAPLALQAMSQRKDVYLEKPISHVFNEGPLLVAAASKFNRVLQQGSQMRSSLVTMQAAKLLAQGIIGEIKVVRAWTAEKRTAVKPVNDSTAPPGVDYDRWLGPAPQRPFNALRFHGTWRLFRDYANGEIGDDGIHDIDMAYWALGTQEMPRQITARGGRMSVGEHASEYPDNMNVTYEFPDGRLLVYENYPFTEYGLHGFDNGNVFYGTTGYMVFSRRGAFQVFEGKKATPGPTEDRAIRGQRGYEQHMTDFLTCVRNRTQPRASAVIGHRSCALVHLAEIAFRTRGQLEFDQAAQRFQDCPEADHMLGKAYRSPYGLPDDAVSSTEPTR